MYKRTHFILPLCLLFSLKAASQLPFNENGYDKIDSIQGSVLYEKLVVRGKKHYQVHCQIIDLRYLTLSNLLSSPDKSKKAEGKYLAVSEYNTSPYFTTYLFEDALKNAKKQAQSKLVGMINGGFFEEMGNSTQMAFPIKTNGTILTAGSSPVGPCDLPKYPYFKDITLKALIWSDSTVEIKDYNTQTGMPLALNAVANGIVSYNYKDHPANVLRPLTTDRFLVVATYRTDSNLVADNALVILTVTNAGIEFAAAHLRQLGIKSDIMALGGSGSAFIYNQKQGLVVSPGMMVNKDGLNAIKLPHFLYFTKKR